MNRFRSVIMLTGCLLMANTLFAFSRQDSLRGGNGNGRNWWDVRHYTLDIKLYPDEKFISGTNRMSFFLTAAAGTRMQIDLQEPMVLQGVITAAGDSLRFSREGNVYWITTPDNWRKGSTQEIVLYYEGHPRQAVRPPWDGGLIWTRDSSGKTWLSVACQGLGASCWWPCKDQQSDEPDQGMALFFDQDKPGNMTLISNGRKEKDTLLLKDNKGEGAELPEHWQLSNPVNNYDATFYAGDYTHWSDTFNGLKGVLDLDFYPLRINESKAREQFRQVKQMLQAFEYWFGPYPFYADGYKIVEAPFLGMEHQSAIAYGNLYRPGYLGRDRSGTGVGLLFDFIIVHESGHEWFGNSVTAEDIADNWIHEGFTTYSETLFAEYHFGKEKAFEYSRGEWKNIRNDKPVIGVYGVHEEGSGDMYDKGSAVVHTIRLIMNNDERFRGLLHAICDSFYHKQVSSSTLESFISRQAGIELQPVFDQYLRGTAIPQLEYRVRGNKLEYRFTHTVPGFSLPVPVQINGTALMIRPADNWQTLDHKVKITGFSVPPVFLIHTKKSGA